MTFIRTGVLKHTGRGAELLSDTTSQASSHSHYTTYLSQPLCIQLLTDVRQFHASRGDHTAALARVSEEYQVTLKAASELRERLRGVDVSAYSDEVLAIVGSQAVVDMIDREMQTVIIGKELFAEIIAMDLRARTYGKLWDDLQLLFAVTDMVGIGI